MSTETTGNQLFTNLEKFTVFINLHTDFIHKSRSYGWSIIYKFGKNQFD